MSVGFMNMLARGRRILGYLRAFGVREGVRIFTKVAITRRGVVRVNVPQVPEPVFLRAGTSDKATFEQVFVFKEYDLSTFNLAPSVIIDGGANIGLSTRYFAHKYPNARIVGIEPEMSNYELLVRNTTHLAKVTPLQGALWNCVRPLAIENPDDQKWAFRVKESAASTIEKVRAFTIPDIMASADCTWVDILKLDIEGAEKELFEANYETWLDHIGLIVVELHDRLRKGCSETFFRAVRPYGFVEFPRGEHVVLVRERARA